MVRFNDDLAKHVFDDNPHITFEEKMNEFKTSHFFVANKLMKHLSTISVKSFLIKLFNVIIKNLNNNNR